MTASCDQYGMTAPTVGGRAATAASTRRTCPDAPACRFFLVRAGVRIQRPSPSQTMCISQSQAKIHPVNSGSQVLRDVLDIEWKPRGRVAIVAGNKRRAPFGDWEAMAVVASSHIDDPRRQGLVFQDDVHHACPMRCPCPLFRVSWAQLEGAGINLQPMFPPACGFHKGETGHVELRQPHAGGPPGSGDCNSKSRIPPPPWRGTHADHPEGKAATRRLRGCGGNGEQATAQSHQCCGAGAEPYTSPIKQHAE